MESTRPPREYRAVALDDAGNQSGLEYLLGLLEGNLPNPPFAETADVWPAEVEPGRIVFEAMPSKRFYNPMGIVHGGWIALLLDTVMGSALHSTLDASQTFSTVEMKTTFLKPIREATGKLRGEGVLLHKGARIASCEGKIFNAAGELVAHGSETCLISTRAI